jgi:hypothetical protein
MGRGKKRTSFLASLFGCKKHCFGEKQEEPPQRHYQGTRVRTSDDDEYYGRHWYAERDIDKRASDYIERVHRGMLADAEKDGYPRPCACVQA